MKFFKLFLITFLLMGFMTAWGTTQTSSPESDEVALKFKIKRILHTSSPVIQKDSDIPDIPDTSTLPLLKIIYTGNYEFPAVKWKWWSQSQRTHLARKRADELLLITFPDPDDGRVRCVRVDSHQIEIKKGAHRNQRIVIMQTRGSGLYPSSFYFHSLEAIVNIKGEGFLEKFDAIRRSNTSFEGEKRFSSWIPLVKILPTYSFNLEVSCLP